MVSTSTDIILDEDSDAIQKVIMDVGDGRAFSNDDVPGSRKTELISQSEALQETVVGLLETQLLNEKTSNGGDYGGLTREMRKRSRTIQENEVGYIVYIHLTRYSS